MTSQNIQLETKADSATRAWQRVQRDFDKSEGTYRVTIFKGRYSLLSLPPMRRVQLAINFVQKKKNKKITQTSGSSSLNFY